jgi:membrane peptidoglycan carboxypeptidase
VDPVGGAHTRSARSAGSRLRRGRQPAGLGWWQPPKVRRSAAGAGPGPDDQAPRHRSQTAAAEPRSAERLRRLRPVLAGAVITGLAGPLALFTVGYLALRVPDPADAVQPQQVALVSFADGSQLGPLVPAAGTRVTVPIERVPAHVRAAVLAAADPGFYRSAGFDAITQQYLRQARHTDEGAGSPWRRFVDLVLNVKISQQRSKDEILADYLNSAYFGRGSYGIQAAAQAYFGKDVPDLTTSEGALLAGLLRAPAGSDPAQHPDQAAQHWNAVLDGMTAEGWLDRGARAVQQLPPTIPRRPVTVGVPADSSGHVVAAVAAELTELGISERELSGGGLRITTTLDPRRQQQAVQSARGAPDQRAGAPRSAMVAIDPATGGVLAYYGGDDGRGTDYARVQQQAGPTFTPFVVLARLLGAPKAGKKVEPGAVAAAARAAGVTAAPDDENQVSAVDLASAYATFAADGVWRAPHLVASVSTADGRVLYRAAPRAERRFAPQVARTVTETMREGAGRDGLALPGGRPVAARTGTVESESDAAQPDAWMAGFTPELATSVWVGTDRNAPARTRSAWREFMTEALSEPPAPERGPDPAAGTPEPDATEAAGPATTPTTPTTTPAAPSANGPTTTTGTSRPARPPGRPSARPPASSTADDPTTSARSSPRTTTGRPDPDDADETDETDEPSGTAGERTTDRARPADESD